MADLNRHDVPAGVDTSGWTLSVTGDVEEALSITYGDLRSFPRERYRGDFACEEGWVAEDLAWRGVPVDAVLSRAGPLDAGEYGLVRAMDGDYACALPMTHLRASVLALELDGERLPPEHGGPARLVPTYGDRDCWESVKWVTEIEVFEENPTRTDTARNLALSRID